MKILISRSNVVSIVDRIRNKHRREFVDKIQKLVSDMPDTFKRQGKLEEWLKQESLNIRAKGRSSFKADLLSIRPVLKEFENDAPVPYALMSVMDKYGLSWLSEEENARLEEVAKAFFQKHRAKILQVLKTQLADYKALEAAADKQDWAIKNWRRYASIQGLGETQEALEFFSNYKA